MLKKENLVNEANIMYEAPKTIDYNDKTAFWNLKENLILMEMKKALIVEIKNECKNIDEKINENAKKWIEEKSQGASMIEYDEFIKKIGSDKLEERRGLLKELLNDSELLYHLYKRNFEYFLDYYTANIVYLTIDKYNGKRVGEMTAEKINKEFEENFFQSDFGRYLKEKNKNTNEFRLCSSYVTTGIPYINRYIHVQIMGINRDYYIFDKENEVIDVTNGWFEINHELYDTHDIMKLAGAIKNVYKEMQEELNKFNKNREIFNWLTCGVCTYIREPNRLYDLIDFSK